MLRQFVDAGGTLITLDSSSELAVTLLGAPLRDVTRGLSANEFFCPGSIVRIELDEDPLTYGMPRETAGFCSFNTAYEVAARSASAPSAGPVSTARIIGRYAKSNVLHERLARRREGDCRQRRDDGSAIRTGPRGAVRVPAATSRPGARHVPPVLQRHPHFESSEP